jgi:hypothetical protein
MAARRQEEEEPYTANARVKRRVMARVDHGECKSEG